MPSLVPLLIQSVRASKALLVACSSFFSDVIIYFRVEVGRVQGVALPLADETAVSGPNWTSVAKVATAGDLEPLEERSVAIHLTLFLQVSRNLVAVHFDDVA
jgi:hypothetical protein